jgi:hypothetical protein
MAQNVVLVTTMGEITVELYTEHAPKVLLPQLSSLTYATLTMARNRPATTFPH